MNKIISSTSTCRCDAIALTERVYSLALKAETRRTMSTQDPITKDYLGFSLIHKIHEANNVAPLMAYVQHLLDMGLSFRTVNNYASALKQI